MRSALYTSPSPAQAARSPAQESHCPAAERPAGAPGIRTHKHGGHTSTGDTFLDVELRTCMAPAFCPARGRHSLACPLEAHTSAASQHCFPALLPSTASQHCFPALCFSTGTSQGKRSRNGPGKMQVPKLQAYPLRQQTSPDRKPSHLALNSKYSTVGPHIVLLTIVEGRFWGGLHLLERRDPPEVQQPGAPSRAPASPWCSTGAPSCAPAPAGEATSTPPAPAPQENKPVRDCKGAVEGASVCYVQGLDVLTHARGLLVLDRELPPEHPGSSYA